MEINNITYSDKTKKVLTIRETAKAFDFPEFALRTLVKTGRFPVIQVGSRVYIVRETFEAYIQSGGKAYDSKR